MIHIIIEHFKNGAQTVYGCVDKQSRVMPDGLKYLYS
jgi:hypothetical protein